MPGTILSTFHMFHYHPPLLFATDPRGGLMTLPRAPCSLLETCMFRDIQGYRGLGQGLEEDVHEQLLLGVTSASLPWQKPLCSSSQSSWD